MLLCFSYSPLKIWSQSGKGSETCRQVSPPKLAGRWYRKPDEGMGLQDTGLPSLRCWYRLAGDEDTF